MLVNTDVYLFSMTVEQYWLEYITVDSPYHTDCKPFHNSSKSQTLDY